MREFKDIKKILVIKLRHIGDVLLTVPVFRALRETFPNAYISALVNSGTEEALAGNPLIDELIVFNRNIKKKSTIQKYIEELSFLKAIRGRGFDMAIDLTSGDRAAIISLIAGAKYRLAYDPAKDGFLGKRYFYTHLAQRNGNQHMVLQNLDLVKQFGISTDDPKVDFYIPDEARLFVRRIFEENNIKANDTVVHVHPTSRWLFKCWKDEYMAEVIKWLIGQRVKVIMTSSPDKREMGKAKKILSLVSDPSHPTIVEGGDGGVIDLCGKTNIKQLAAISEASDLFLGVDSAPMHIAAAVGTSVIALFGPTDDVQWRPWNDKTIVIKESLQCMPCKKGACEGMPLRKCMESIEPNVVKNIIREILLRNAKHS
ncbi:MAG: putative lipopolysaccharide heptosyltransferase III [Nitrospira bacterium HGW-Nitrospira-1]|nr:MAG: putative lipopolysaccharide heptosyltransferase III [Nitrospira bacterium HGW-Nitrospira-1]